MRKQIIESVQEGIKATSFLLKEEALLFIEKATLAIVDCYERKGKLLIAGNGGSICDASHFAEEMTGFFRTKRRALPAIAINDPGHLTCVGNDMGFAHVFARGIEALGEKGDIFIALTTSGNSENLVEAVKMAKEKGLQTIAFLGKKGGVLRGMCDLEWIVSGFPFSDRIQEAHMTAIHIIIEMVEKILFSLIIPSEKIAIAAAIG
ncbi:MAG: SIS domain-containing protein [Simkania negevensis]|nr:SIS domain-containing protein [Simkania negevensis]